jgi:chromosomal replication initiator protein
MGTHIHNEDFDPTGTAYTGTDAPGAPRIWRDVVADLRTRVTADDYQRFIDDLRLIAEIDGDIVVAARSKYAHDCVDAEHRRMIQRLWRRRDPRERGVRLVCWASEATKFADIVEDPWAQPARDVTKGDALENTCDTPDASVTDRAHATFETLVTGASNACAARLMRHIADGGD